MVQWAKGPLYHCSQAGGVQVYSAAASPRHGAKSTKGARALQALLLGLQASLGPLALLPSPKGPQGLFPALNPLTPAKERARYRALMGPMVYGSPIAGPLGPASQALLPGI